ncbi:uncharacterized protein LOC121258690 [Juglans microcarpa x Juglans regia]|uniref:uncharacterized protein LOC121258690 n=1 Tax=Juglans microcarpa x Juglans regia TaxID=2249226 RepID=UPI001B7F2D54|nr:uncharacterized protein LOC121258690 [Juglans microcarpa x Juglans regia]
MIEAENSMQLHEAEILEMLQKDSSENSDMADTTAEEQPDEMAVEKVVDTSQYKKWVEIRQEIEKNEGPEGFTLKNDGLLYYKGQRVIPAGQEIKDKILWEAHQTPYTTHPGTTKMYHDLKQHFWREGLKKDVVDYVNRCSICRTVKAENQRPAGDLQSLPIP